MKLQPAHIYAAVLGAMGASIGAVVGGGVGETWHELLLGLLIVAFAVFVGFEQLPFISIHRTREFMAGAIAGLAAEYFTPNPILIAVVGVVAGVIGVPAVQLIGDRILGFLSRYPRAFRSIVLGILGAILIPLFLWAQSRGILRDVLLATLCITIPILLAIMGRNN